MRDSLIALLFLTAFFGGYYYARKSGYGFIGMNATFSQKGSKTKGEIHDSKSNLRTGESAKGDGIQGHGQGEGASVDGSEAEGLPYIYATQEYAKRRKQPRSEPPLKSNDDSLERAPQRPSITGVPVDDWVLAQRDSIHYSYLEEPADLSMRIFVQCMELKRKHLEYLGADGCQDLIARTQASDFRQQKSY